MKRQIKRKHLLWAIVPISLGILLAIIATKSIGYEKISPITTQIELMQPPLLRAKTPLAIFISSKTPTKNQM
jgi:hypothetical protein